MNSREMMELLEKIKVEHTAFDLKPERAEMWFEKFKHLEPKQFARLCLHVLEVQRYTPTFADFAKADKELFGEADRFKPVDPKAHAAKLATSEAEMRAKGFHKRITGRTPKGVTWVWVRNDFYDPNMPRCTPENLRKVRGVAPQEAKPTQEPIFDVDRGELF